MTAPHAVPAVVDAAIDVLIELGPLDPSLGPEGRAAAALDAWWERGWTFVPRRELTLLRTLSTMFVLALVALAVHIAAENHVAVTALAGGVWLMGLTTGLFVALKRHGKGA